MEQRRSHKALTQPYSNMIQEQLTTTRAVSRGVQTLLHTFRTERNHPIPQRHAFSEKQRINILAELFPQGADDGLSAIEHEERGRAMLIQGPIGFRNFAVFLLEAILFAIFFSAALSLNALGMALVCGLLLGTGGALCCLSLSQMAHRAVPKLLLHTSAYIILLELILVVKQLTSAF